MIPHLRDKAPSSIRARIAGTWHWFAMLGVLGMGVFWFFKGLTGETGALIPLEFAHRNVTVYLPPDASQTASSAEQNKGAEAAGTSDKKFIGAGAAGAIAASQIDEDMKKTKGK